MKELELVGYQRAKCPACGKDSDIRSEYPQKSGLYSHYYGKKCRKHRKENEGEYPSERELTLLIVQARNKGRGREKDADNKEKARKAAEKIEARAKIYRKHTLTGGFLMEVVIELKSALDMMEPYYSQCNAGDDGQSMVSRLESIISSKPE